MLVQTSAVIVPLFKLVAKFVLSSEGRLLFRDIVVGAMGNELFALCKKYAPSLTRREVSQSKYAARPRHAHHIAHTHQANSH